MKIKVTTRSKKRMAFEDKRFAGRDVLPKQTEHYPFTAYHVNSKVDYFDEVA